jgi:hypothetical protein
MGGTYECDKEENDVHDPQRKACFQHRARLVHMERERIIDAASHISKWPQIQVDTIVRVAEVCAVRISDSSQLVHTGNQCANEAEIDECDKGAACSRAMVHDERTHCPCARQHGNDEEDKDEGWCELIVFREAMDEPREHADDWNQCDNLDDAPKGEEHSRNHDSCVISRGEWSEDGLDIEFVCPSVNKLAMMLVGLG